MNSGFRSTFGKSTAILSYTSAVLKVMKDNLVLKFIKTTLLKSAGNFALGSKGYNTKYYKKPKPLSHIRLKPLNDTNFQNYLVLELTETAKYYNQNR